MRQKIVKIGILLASILPFTSCIQQKPISEESFNISNSILSDESSSQTSSSQISKESTMETSTNDLPMTSISSSVSESSQKSYYEQSTSFNSSWPKHELYTLFTKYGDAGVSDDGHKTYSFTKIVNTNDVSRIFLFDIDTVTLVMSACTYFSTKVDGNYDLNILGIVTWYWGDFKNGLFYSKYSATKIGSADEHHFEIQFDNDTIVFQNNSIELASRFSFEIISNTFPNDINGNSAGTAFLRVQEAIDNVRNNIFAKYAPSMRFY